ncbi:MAG TPA: hypothetical protein PLK12_02470 [Prolixibacteraceae bacterium]|nr:hypothetical protein [Prolixibacteraceae bacterium]
MKPKENINFIYQFNNKARAGNVFVLFIASGVVFLGAAFYFLAVNQNLPLLAVVGAGIVYFILFTRLRPSFFELLVTDTALQVNYYSVATTMRNYQSIEIGFSSLSGFAIRRAMKGLRPELILSVDSSFGVADYPPVSLSLVSRIEQKQLNIILEQILKQKNPPQ